MSRPNTDRRDRTRGHQDVSVTEARSSKRAANAAAAREAREEAMSPTTATLMAILVALREYGIVYPAGRDVEPQKCDYIPRNAKDFKGPVGISYEDIDQAVLDEYVSLSQYEGIYSVHMTYKGRLFYWLNSGRANRDYIRRWREQNSHGKYRICCNKALPFRCVCFLPTDCPDHGMICRGTHD